MHLPSPSQAESWLAELGVSPADRSDVLGARPLVDADPALRSIAADRLAELVAAMGSTGPLPAWPRLQDRYGRSGGLVYPWVLLAAVPQVRAYHDRRGIDRDVGTRSLAVLGTQMRDHRALYGYGGLHTHDWLTRHFRGALYVLGRLHVERATWSGVSAAAEGGPAVGEPVLDLHIPEGRLTPESVDAALDTARRFFAAHFPEEPYRYATCTSWVLDPQLHRYLSASSNILRFQHRFTLTDDPGSDMNATVVEFVFHRPVEELDRLPRDTTLQRGLVDHVRAGGTWRFRTGWFRLD